MSHRRGAESAKRCTQSGGNELTDGGSPTDRVAASSYSGISGYLDMAVPVLVPVEKCGATLRVGCPTFSSRRGSARFWNSPAGRPPRRMLSAHSYDKTPNLTENAGRPGRRFEYDHFLAMS